jgi:hypothetical protein
MAGAKNSSAAASRGQDRNFVSLPRIDDSAILPDGALICAPEIDRNDARGIARLMRLGWLHPVHCKSLAARETRARSFHIRRFRSP